MSTIDHNNPTNPGRAPEKYEERGGQTPNYTPPPMPQVQPAKSPDSPPKK